MGLTPTSLTRAPSDFLEPRIDELLDKRPSVFGSRRSTGKCSALLVIVKSVSYPKGLDAFERDARARARAKR